MQSPVSKLLCPLLLLPLVLTAGCAKSPSGGGASPVSGPQLLITMTVAGNINPNDYYYILFNVNNTPGPTGTSVTGPVPVVVSADNTGNGYAAGAYTNYVEYNGGQPSGGTNFNYYAVSANLFQSQPLGPGQLIRKNTAGNTLTFQLPLAYLATTNVTADQINTLQINFITTNTVPQSVQNLATPKYFDALYPPSQSSSYVTVIVRNPGGAVQTRTFTNTDSGVNEAAGDVAQYVSNVPVIVGGTTPDGVATADLDITGWTISLTSQ